MKNAIKILSLLIAALLLLPACSGATSESGPESPAPDNEKATGLPDSYFVKYGVLYLKMEPCQSDIDVGIMPTLAFDSVEELKEKFLNLSFTEEELKIITIDLLKNGKFPVIDPRLFAPLNLPEGVSLKSVSYGLNSSKNSPRCSFQLLLSDDFSSGSHMYAIMQDHSGITDTYEEKVIGEWINKDGGYDTDRYTLIEETTYKGYPALCLTKVVDKGANEREKTVYWRYVVTKNDRTYYISDKIVYKDDSQEEIVKRTASVETLHRKCEYTYTIENPTEECVDNILEYDPFTYVEIVE